MGLPALSGALLLRGLVPCRYILSLQRWLQCELLKITKKNGICAKFPEYRAPISGGQYFWVSIFAPPKYKRFLSYMTGMLDGFFASRLRCGHLYWRIFLAVGF